MWLSSIAGVDAVIQCLRLINTTNIISLFSLPLNWSNISRSRLNIVVFSDWNQFIIHSELFCCVSGFTNSENLYNQCFHFVLWQQNEACWSNVVIIRVIQQRSHMFDSKHCLLACEEQILCVCFAEQRIITG